MAVGLKSTVRRIWQSAIPLFLLLSSLVMTAQEPSQGPDEWVVRTKTDIITDRQIVEAIIEKTVEDNGRAERVDVAATCDSQSLTFRLITLDGRTFKQNPNSFTKPRVYMRVRLDQNEAFSVGSASDHPNEAFVRFAKESHDAITVLSNMGSGPSPVEAMVAHLIRVELPLDNGDAPILEIRPQAPSLKKLISECGFQPAPQAPAKKSSLQTLTNRRYAGTVEGFAPELPGFVRRAATVMGLRPEDYGKETAFIAAAVRTCAQITPQMYASMGRIGRPDFSKIGAEYKVCNPRTEVSDVLNPGISGPARRGIEMEMSGIGRGLPGDDRGFSVVVSFSIQNGDSATYRNIGFDNLGIVSATLYSSAAAVKQPLTATPLQSVPNRRYTGTLEGFARDLPGFVQRAASAMSLNPDHYAKDVEFVIKIVRTCAQITPEMARQNAVQNSGRVNLLKLGDKYRFCQSAALPRNISDEVRTYDKEHERGIQLQVEPGNGDWRNGEGFNLVVQFAPLRNETLISPSSYFDMLGIVMATVR